MEIQSRLGKNAKKPYSGICCEPCWNATHIKCVCRCGGVYHGLGRNQLKEGQPWFYLTLIQADPFKKQITVENCMFCGKSLKHKKISGWGPHSGGWNVKGLKEKQWLYIKCDCGQEWALHYLGVSR